MDHCCSVAFEAPVYCRHLISLKVTPAPGMQMPSERTVVSCIHRFVLEVQLSEVSYCLYAL